MELESKFKLLFSALLHLNVGRRLLDDDGDNDDDDDSELVDETGELAEETIELLILSHQVNCKLLASIF